MVEVIFQVIIRVNIQWVDYKCYNNILIYLKIELNELFGIIEIGELNDILMN